MKPQLVFAADRCNVRERIDGTGADGPGRADDQKRLVAEAEILLDFTAKSTGVHPLVGIGRNPPDRIGAEPGDVSGFLQPRMRLR